MTRSKPYAAQLLRKPNHSRSSCKKCYTFYDYEYIVTRLIDSYITNYLRSIYKPAAARSWVKRGIEFTAWCFPPHPLHSMPFPRNAEKWLGTNHGRYYRSAQPQRPWLPSWLTGPYWGEKSPWVGYYTCCDFNLLSITNRKNKIKNTEVPCVTIALKNCPNS